VGLRRPAGSVGGYFLIQPVGFAANPAVRKILTGKLGFTKKMVALS
jgi:hypothetical protein